MRQSSFISRADKIPKSGSFGPSAHAPGTGASVRVREQVLVVDSDPESCRRLVGLLDRHGITARCFHSAQSLLDAEMGDEVACLVIDVELPDMDGIELLECLNRGRRPVPAIVVAAGDDVATAVRAIRANAVDFFEKPVVENLLLKCIRQVMAHEADRD